MVRVGKELESLQGRFSSGTNKRPANCGTSETQGKEAVKQNQGRDVLRDAESVSRSEHCVEHC